MLGIELSADDLLDAQQWIRWRTGIIASAVSTAITALVLGTLCGAQVATVILTALAFPVALSLWWAGRELYWRTGRGYRVGLVFEGVRVPPAELRRTRELFAAMAESAALHHRVSLRLLPESYALTEERRLKFAGRYRLKTVAQISVHAKDGASAGARLSYAVPPPAKGSRSSALWESARLPLAALMARAPTSKSPHDILESLTQSLFEVLLFVLATVAVDEQRHSDASLLLLYLDSVLDRRGVPAAVEPRQAIRRMDMHCSLEPLTLRASDTPDGPAREDWLREVTDLSHRYGAEFPDIYVTLARVHFLCDEFDAARRHCETLLTARPEALRPFGLLGLALLDLVKGEYAASHANYNAIALGSGFGQFNMPDLIDFADHCRNDGYINAIFAQVLYRRLNGTSVTAPMLQELDDWFRADRSREVLRPLINKAQPAPKSPGHSARQRVQPKRYKKRKL